LLLSAEHVSVVSRYQRSERSDHDVGRGRCIEADGPTVDFDHTLLAVALAEQLKLATRHETKTGHPGAGSTITVNRADAKTAVAAGLGQGRGRQLGPLTAVPFPAAFCQKIGKKNAATFGMICTHEDNSCLVEEVMHS
jgi:hypothetical protein